jgi:hypothetical protein
MFIISYIAVNGFAWELSTVPMQFEWALLSVNIIGA